MKGLGGKSGWAWIFIIEGLVTIVAGVISFWVIQDFPDTASKHLGSLRIEHKLNSSTSTEFLTEEERTLVIRRLQGDDQYSAAGEILKKKNIISSMIDVKTWIGST
jgi:predicted nucleic acid-binding protein